MNHPEIAAIAMAFGSVLGAELVRDCYHVLAHVWQPLYRLHVQHHRVFKPDLSVVSEAIYRQANWYNDLPESLVMLLLSGVLAWVIITQGWLEQYQWTAWMGSVYSLTFTAGAIARGLGIPHADEITDFTHTQGNFESLPANWFVNRPYHWRHHFDNQNAYFCGTFTLVDKIMGTALSLKGKKIAVTGASGTLGKALLKQLHLRGAKVTGLTSKHQEIFIEVQGKNLPITTIKWEVGKELEVTSQLEKIDILILNHGINGYGERTEKAISLSYEINTFSSWRLMELFLNTVRTNEDIARKEVWVNTSEAEVSPAFSPLYELSKRTLGDLVTLRRLDAACVIRKLIIGPFKSNLNPIGVMSGDWVAQQIVNLAMRDFRNIIVTINPLTYIAFPVKELLVSTYFKLFSQQKTPSTARRK
jgi:sterol desaturase/sphingolipid hydroxylase (fatty acid hydroxylase superfamily)